MEDKKVIISLEEYNELLETKKKYESSDNGKLEYTIGRLKNSDYELRETNSWLEYKNSTIKNETTKTWLKRFRDFAIENENIFGYVNAKKIYGFFLNNNVNVSEYDIYRPYPSRFDDMKIALNKTESLKDADVLKLQTDIERVIRRFLANNPSFKDGYELNFSIDDLPSLLENGTTCASSDAALTILDKDNNKIIESI